jgi:MFS family permease
MNSTNPSTTEPGVALTQDQTGVIASLRALPRAAWILFLGVFLNRFGTFIIPFLSLYMKRKGFSFTDSGVAIGAYGAGTLVACLLGGYLADHIGRRKTITLSMFSGAVMMLLLWRADSWWGIVLLTGLNGLCAEAYRPASTALLADLVPNGQRVIAFTTYRIALNAGWMFGPATAGFVATHSFGPLFVGDAVSSMLFGVVAWVALPHGVRSSKDEAGWGTAVRSIAGNSRFLQYLVATAFITWIFYQISSTYGLFIDQLGYSPFVYGSLISFNGLVVASLELIVSNFTRRFPPRRAIACGYLLVGIGFGLNILGDSIPWLAFAMLIVTFGEMSSLPIGVAYIADLAPPDMRGRYMGAYGLTWSLTLIFGPAFGMHLLAKSATLLWLACACSGVIGAALMLPSWAVGPRHRNPPVQGEP